MKREYAKHEFCKSVNCSCYLCPSETHNIAGGCCFENAGDCIKTAKEFHMWLKGNGFNIELRPRLLS